MLRKAPRWCVASKVMMRSFMPWPGALCPGRTSSLPRPQKPQILLTWRHSVLRIPGARSLRNHWSARSLRDSVRMGGCWPRAVETKPSDCGAPAKGDNWGCTSCPTLGGGTRRRRRSEGGGVSPGSPSIG
ncbi:hypothetical protein DPMN_100801 [Dreissena polymorpha]|uniref:Uncharacterized protein n=1 Tax=Dreissena polymorpha TaxID=45954 RepID=A0A9D4R7R7_DREPO|nr:hypothetical protein DPMN_100801 [Dreissena polymorpha]